MNAELHYITHHQTVDNTEQKQVIFTNNYTDKGANFTFIPCAITQRQQEKCYKKSYNELYFIDYRTGLVQRASWILLYNASYDVRMVHIMSNDG